MQVDDMVFGFNDVRFEDLVSQTAIQTNEDKEININHYSYLPPKYYLHFYNQPNTVNHYLCIGVL